MGVVIITALMGAATAFAVFSVVKARRRARRATFEALAERLGLHFFADDTFGLLQQLKDFGLFHRVRRWWFKRSNRISNVLRGTVGDTEVFLFDYTYVVYSNNSARRVTQTVFFANDKNWFLPGFQLKPESWWRKVLAAFGKKEIDFPDSPDFSDRFWLTGEFESLIRKTFGPEVQQFLLERPPLHLEGNNYYLLAYKPRKALNDAEAEAFFNRCCELVKLLKKQEDKLELLNLAELKTKVEVPSARNDLQ